MIRSRRFDDETLAAIAEAVEAAEDASSAEIVTYIVGRCDEYRETDWAGVVFGAGLGVIAWLAVTQIAGTWSAGSALTLAYVVMIGAVVGRGLASIPAIRRFLVPNRVLDGRTRVRAEAAFVEEEVFATRERTGILMFLALFEHRCVVLADAGVLERVPCESLAEPVRVTCEGIRAGRPAEGVLAGIGACRRILADAGLQRSPDDADELSNWPRVREE